MLGGRAEIKSGGLVFGAVLLGASSALAAEAPRVPISFEAPCGAVDAFARGIEERLPQLSVQPVTRDPTVRVEVTEDERGAQATLTILLENGGELTRSIEASNCEEAVATIQFVTAVALDPDASAPVQVRTTLSASEEEEPFDDLAGSGGSPEPQRVIWSVGISGVATIGPAPQVMPGGAINLGVGQRRAGWWSPSVQFGAGFAARGGFERSGGTAGFQMLRGHVDLCPSRGRAGAWSLRPCLQSEFARLRAEGTETIDPAVAYRPWIAPGASVILEAGLGRYFAVVFRGAVGVPLVRDAFDFDGVVFHQVSPVSATFGLGVAAQF